MPKISVVMSVYNSERYLSEAIESILNQSYTDFEFIIIDDASTDSSCQILQQYAQKDKRIKIIRNDINSGLGVSLQKGIQNASGDLIARMDSDDICPKNRFQKQIDFLQKNPEIMVLGGDHIIINEKGEQISVLNYPKSDSIMRWNMGLGNGLIVSNGALMMHRKFITQIGNYGDYRAAQDFELWSRLFEHEILPIRNLSDYIYFYRRHAETITNSQKELQENNAIRVRQKNLEQLLGFSIQPEVISSYRHTSYNYENIEEHMLMWVEIYYKFIEKFSVQERDLVQIRDELLQRINNYTYLNPKNNSTSGRVLYWHLVNILPYKISAALLDKKIRYFFKKPAK